MRAASWEGLGRHKHKCNMAVNFHSLGFSESKSSSEKENESIYRDNV